MSDRIAIKYRCECMAEKVDLDVPARQPAIGVVLWVQGIVMHKVAADHARRSPACRAQTMAELLIPTPEGGGDIGSAPEIRPVPE